jgi:orotate phosphoribosyltransferase
MTESLKPFQKGFIDLAVAHGALSFGEFKLKSGRLSPYFFNAGRFSTGAALAGLGACYADAIVSYGLEFDFLFGPAYKGIPLVAVTAAALAREHGRDVPCCFNRKEAKDHGEGGVFVGAQPKGRGLLVDDVITAGTAIRESIGLIEASGASLGAVLIGLDRQERGTASSLSAVQQVRAEAGIRVESIVTLDHIRHYLADANDTDLLRRIEQYQAEYGI